MKNILSPSTYVKWIGRVQTVGPRGIIAIRPGDVRKLVEHGETRSWLEGENGVGLFGTVDNKDFEILP